MQTKPAVAHTATRRLRILELERQDGTGCGCGCTGSAADPVTRNLYVDGKSFSAFVRATKPAA
jgi:hypothetical protein